MWGTRSELITYISVFETFRITQSRSSQQVESILFQVHKQSVRLTWQSNCRLLLNAEQANMLKMTVTFNYTINCTMHSTEFSFDVRTKAMPCLLVANMIVKISLLNGHFNIHETDFVAICSFQ